MGIRVTGATIARTLPNADLSGLPTTDPTGGKPWNNQGFITTGAGYTPVSEAALTAALAAKADDSLVVHKAGAETITGLKTMEAGLVVTGGGLSGSVGLVVGSYDVSSAAIWYSGLTPSTTNNGIRFGSTYTKVEGPSQVILSTAGANRWAIDSSGNLDAANDNTYDIGASGANRPRDFYLGRNATLGGTAAINGATRSDSIGLYVKAPTSQDAIVWQANASAATVGSLGANGSGHGRLSLHLSSGTRWLDFLPSGAYFNDVLLVGGNSVDTTKQFQVVSQGATKTVLALKGATSQSGKLIEALDSLGTSTLFSVSSTGNTTAYGAAAENVLTAKSSTTLALHTGAYIQAVDSIDVNIFKVTGWENSGNIRARVYMSTAGAGMWVTGNSDLVLASSASNPAAMVTSAGVRLWGNRIISWINKSWTGERIESTTVDLGITRNAAGVLEINNGTAGTLADLTAANATFTGNITMTADMKVGTSSNYFMPRSGSFRMYAGSAMVMESTSSDLTLKPSQNFSVTTANTIRQAIDINGNTTFSPVWNDTLTTFTGVKVNVTDTTSATASLLQDWQVGGTSMAFVGKDGTVGVTKVAFIGTNSNDYGFFGGSSTRMNFGRFSTGTSNMQFSGGTNGLITFNRNGLIYWSGSTSSAAGGGTTAGIRSTAAGIVEVTQGANSLDVLGTFRADKYELGSTGLTYLRYNGGNVELVNGDSTSYTVSTSAGIRLQFGTSYATIVAKGTLSVYNTTSGATLGTVAAATYRAYNGTYNANSSVDYERATMGYVSNVFTVGTDAAGGVGVARYVDIIANGVDRIQLTSTSNNYYSNSASSGSGPSHVFYSADGTQQFKIGGSGTLTFANGSHSSADGKVRFTFGTDNSTNFLSGLSTTNYAFKFLNSDSTSLLFIHGNGNSYFYGKILAATDNTYDIGASGATRFKDMYLAGNATVAGVTITPSAPPATAAATGTAGQIQWDADYIYVCTATNTWKRAALVTW